MLEKLPTHGKNNFAKALKNLARYTVSKIVLLSHQNNCAFIQMDCWNVKTFCGITHHA